MDAEILGVNNHAARFVTTLREQESGKKPLQIQVLPSIVELTNALTYNEWSILMTEEIKQAETDNIIMYQSDLRGLVRGELNSLKQHLQLLK
jgi:hypothetical protein